MKFITKKKNIPPKSILQYAQDDTKWGLKLQEKEKLFI